MTRTYASRTGTRAAIAARSGGAGRTLVTLAILAMTACGTTVESIKAGGAFVPWLPLAPAHQVVDPAVSPPSPVPPGAPPCVASQLEGVGLAGGAAAGNVNMPLLIRNKGSAGCYLHGFVDVTVLDRREHVLAQAAGDVGRGTFFADGPLIDVWMPAGTPGLPRPFQTRDGSLGQALLNFSWYDCQYPLAATLVIGLAGGGSFRMSYARQAAGNPSCQNDESTFNSIRRGPLSAAGTQWPYWSVDLKMTMPVDARRGTRISYFVTFTNTSNQPFEMLPCADYTEAIYGKQFPESYQLNCEPVRPIAPGASATFEIRYDVPAAAEPGFRDFSWSLADGRLDAAVASGKLRIT